MPKYKCTVTVSVTTVKEVTEVIEIDAPDEVTAEEDARTAAELIDNETWDANPNMSDSWIEDIQVEDIEIEQELKENLSEDDELDNYNEFIKKTVSKDLLEKSENDNNFDSKSSIQNNIKDNNTTLDSLEIKLNSFKVIGK